MYCEIKYIKYNIIKSIKEIILKLLIVCLTISFIISYHFINYFSDSILKIIVILLYIILILYQINKAYKYCHR